MPQSFACINLHIIFSVKNRQPWLTDDLILRLYPLIGGIVRDRNCILTEIGSVADHVHLLVSMSREEAVAALVREVKAGSSRWIHETFPERSSFWWQSGYAAFAVSKSNLPAVQEYIRGQADHHRTKTFQEEYLDFLKRHDLTWDERYVWD